MIGAEPAALRFRVPPLRRIEPMKGTVILAVPPLMVRLLVAGAFMERRPALTRMGPLTAALMATLPLVETMVRPLLLRAAGLVMFAKPVTTASPV